MNKWSVALWKLTQLRIVCRFETSLTAHTHTAKQLRNSMHKQLPDVLTFLYSGLSVYIILFSIPDLPKAEHPVFCPTFPCPVNPTPTLSPTPSA